MQTSNPPLPMGYSPVPPGKLVNAVTCLEMLEAPASRGRTRPDPEGLVLDHVERPDLGEYRRLFRRIGEDWMWDARLVMSDEDLAATIHHPLVAVHVLSDRGEPVGLVELDFRREGECEIVYFGLAREAIGRGAGRVMMDRAVALAWSRPIRRLWLHTCHFDHPGALVFYQRSGFRPYAFMVEVLDDPRLTGSMPRGAAPHIPVIG